MTGSWHKNSDPFDYVIPQYGVTMTPWCYEPLNMLVYYADGANLVKKKKKNKVYKMLYESVLAAYRGGFGIAHPEWASGHQQSSPSLDNENLITF